MSMTDEEIKKLTDEVTLTKEELEKHKEMIKTLQEEKAQLKEDIKNLSKGDNKDKELSFNDFAKIFMEGLN